VVVTIMNLQFLQEMENSLTNWMTLLHGVNSDMGIIHM
jgi:hypothetical protein